MPRRRGRARLTTARQTGHARGIDAEAIAARLLEEDGFAILARRARTPAGELDLVAHRGPLLAFIEVKRRRTLADAAAALAPRQRARLLAAAECWLAANPAHAAGAMRFDVIVVDAAGAARRVADAFRIGD